MKNLFKKVVSTLAIGVGFIFAFPAAVYFPLKIAAIGVTAKGYLSFVMMIGGMISAVVLAGFVLISSIAALIYLWGDEDKRREIIDEVKKVIE